MLSHPPEASSSDASTGVGLGVAFGGGGMKGWAHVGVISVLDRLGLRPSVVAGCSAGALVGAYYAYGYSLEEMRQFMREQRTSSLFALRLDGLGLLGTEGFRDYLQRHLGDCTFEDLDVPFYVVATDLETGREVVLNRGSLVDAVLASSAMPGIFAPVEIDGRLLIDGGLCNNVPVSALVNHGARYTVGVRLHRDANSLEAPSMRKHPPAGQEQPVSLAMWTERLARSIRRQNGHLPNGFEVIGRVMEIVVSQIERYRLQAYPPDVLIAPEVSHINVLSFSEEKEEIFACGVQAAEEQEVLLRKIARRLGVTVPS